MCRSGSSIPFLAVRGFYDPSVSFELEIDDKLEPAEKQERDGPDATDHCRKGQVQTGGRQGQAGGKSGRTAESEEAGDGKPMADVVSLDSFRKNK